jgi:hypothetical protein
MEHLTLKLILTPVLVGSASLAGRRWGPTVSGWLVALPLTSGPIVFVLSLTHGARFAAAVAGATLAGAISQAAFCLIYSWLALRWSWPRALLASCLAFVAATTLLQQLRLPILLLFLLVVLILMLTLRLMPRAAAALTAQVRPAPSWDIATRIVVTTIFVLLLTGSAPALGAQLTGLLAPFPLYGAILAVFAHHQDGAVPAIRVLRGLVFGLFSFAGFFLVLAVLLGQIPITWAFGTASAVALTSQGGTLWALGWRTRTDRASRDGVVAELYRP